ncbi:hypothetical protein HPB50_007142 [Hyalomma asiaticum]|uniref:Uncharacterized protein n=1 Tax=Hyalomma asiaticum TaxID=266040 RepID=A0ACB7TI88_HYAAI|nr:hypothetical protein HPB50_007142 [Hyalomma asiaticum]
MAHAAAAAVGLQLAGADLKHSGASIPRKLELLDAIGKGSFGVVYKARTTLDGTLVAAKKVKLKEMVDEKAKKDCLQEIALLQRLDHPHIIKYLASFVEDGELFIVLELADGVGSPYYMSPERIQELDYDFSSDVWSAGCLLYEMAALQSPFMNETKNLYSLVRKIVACEHPPIPSNIYSDELRALVAVCMDPDPKKRRDISYACTVSTQMYQRFVRASECKANTLAST